MPRTLHTFGEYPPDWPEISDRVCEEAGHRCIRCLHPYRQGTHGKGQWSPCDERCTHRGPIAGFEPWDGEPANFANFLLHRPVQAGEAVRQGMIVFAEWRILTVHHFDGHKANCAWWNLLALCQRCRNLLALCQRCHLTIQARVNPQQPYMFEHSDWLKPYVAGFYASKYERRELTRPEVMLRLDDLLAHERIA